MDDRPFVLIERDDILPECPHCGHPLDEVYLRSRGVPLLQGRTYVFFCPTCSKTLGFAQGRFG